MSTNITLYGYNFVSRAERVIWVLNELELPFELIRLDPLKGEMLTEPFLNLNPNAKVPVLVHGDKVLSESVAISEYLHFLRPEKQLMPDTQDAYYQYRHAMSYMVSEIEPYLWVGIQASRLKAFYHWPEGTGESAVVILKKKIPYLFELIGTKPFMLGEQFSIADVFAFQMINWAASFGVELPDPIASYSKRLSQRPSFPAPI